MPQNPTKPNPIYLIYIYKKDLALNNLQWLICHETKSNQTNPEKSDRQLLCSFETEVHLIHLCISYAIKYSNLV